MKIDKLTLVGYTRTMLQGAKRIVYTPESPMQIILGTNGSGKSSLVFELFPLPSNGAFYEKGGYKELEFTHKGHHYVQSSKFDTVTGRHSLIKDGVTELNKSYGPKGLLEVVEREFNLTPQRRDLLLGKTKFSTMEVSARRTLLTDMSDVDFTYALSLYKKFKDYTRDIKGALTLAKKRLVMEQSKIMSKEEIDQITRQVNKLHKEIASLHAVRAPIDQGSDQAKSTIRTYILELENLLQALESINTEQPEGYSYSSLESITEALEAFKQQRHGIRMMVEKLTSDHQKIQKEVELLQQSGGKDVNDLRAQKLEGETVIEQIYQSLSSPLYREITDPYQAQRNFFGVKDHLLEIFNAMPENQELIYSNASIKKYDLELEKYKALKFEIEPEIRKLAGEKDHLEFHSRKGQTECPKCKYGWIIGYDEQRYQTVSKELEELTEKLRQYNEQIESLGDKLAGSLKFISDYRGYLVIKSSNDILSPIWQMLDEGGQSFKSPFATIRQIERIAQDMEGLKNIAVIKSQIDKTSDLLEAFAQSDAKSMNDNIGRAQHLEEEISSLTIQGNTLSNTITIHEMYYSNMERFLTGAKVKIPEIINRILKGSERACDVLVQEYIHDTLRGMQSQLAAQEDILSQVHVQQSMVADLEEQIADLTIKEKAGKVLVKELSPTEGLVAEGLMGFINVFLGEINSVIERIWTYPLEILPCTVEGDENPELSYRFPLITGEDRQRREDIKEGSTGMQDVVDLGFRISAAKRLKLDGFPLFLDEFGSGFDPKHQLSASQIIASILEQGLFEQIFMISHYENSYGALSNSQILVLDDTNIKPNHTKYNDNVVME